MESRREFAKLLAAQVLFEYCITLSVMKIVRFIQKNRSSARVKTTAKAFFNGTPANFSNAFW
jgi:hypothetical protein